MNNPVKISVTFLEVTILLYTLTKSFAQNASNTSNPIVNPAPFSVSIQLKDPVRQFKHQCFGSIIHKQIVLTAAHCFIKNTNPKDFTVTVGNNILNTTSMENRYNVKKIRSNKSFYPLQGNDIALVKLESQLPIDGVNVNMVKLDSERNIGKDQQSYAVGRNKAKQSMEDPHLSLMPHLTIDNRTCRKNKFVEVTKTELCAIASKTVGPCDGDSGSPLVNPDLNTQWGILSYSRSMCKPSRIYVYTRVQPLKNWIDSNIEDLLK